MSGVFLETCLGPGHAGRISAPRPRRTPSQVHPAALRDVATGSQRPKPGPAGCLRPARPTEDPPRARCSPGPAPARPRLRYPPTPRVLRARRARTAGGRQEQLGRRASGAAELTPVGFRGRPRGGRRQRRRRSRGAAAAAGDASSSLGSSRLPRASAASLPGRVPPPDGGSPRPELSERSCCGGAVATPPRGRVRVPVAPRRPRAGSSLPAAGALLARGSPPSSMNGNRLRR